MEGLHAATRFMMKNLVKNMPEQMLLGRFVTENTRPLPVTKTKPMPRFLKIGFTMIY
jgi:hypothetical protein